MLAEKAKTYQLTKRKTPAGFTLVELLTVIMIISLLISILLPSLGTARTMAKVTQTKAIFHGISTGLEMFHNDENVGDDDYPPSSIDIPSGGDPYSGSGGFTAYGAETLVWALMGADMLGTPGFGTNANELHNGSGGLYELDPDNAPLCYRSKPFFEPSKANIGEVDDGQTRSEKARVFLDTFKNPILYYKANASKVNQGDALAKEIYTRDDNAGLLDSLLPDADFERYIKNPKVPSGYQPHNRDSFILISAGPDGEFGTKDDITNFPLDKVANFPAP